MKITVYTVVALFLWIIGVQAFTTLVEMYLLWFFVAWMIASESR